MLDRFDRVIDVTLTSLRRAEKYDEEWETVKMLLAQVVKAEPPEKNLLYQLTVFVNAFNIARDLFKASLIKKDGHKPRKALRDVFDALGNIANVYYHLTGKESHFVDTLNSYFGEFADYVMEDNYIVALDQYKIKEQHISDIVEVMRFFREPYKQFFAELGYAYEAISEKDPSATKHLVLAKEYLDRTVKGLEQF